MAPALDAEICSTIITEDWGENPPAEPVPQQNQLGKHPWLSLVVKRLLPGRKAGRYFYAIGRDGARAKRRKRYQDEQRETGRYKHGSGRTGDGAGRRNLYQTGDGGTRRESAG